MESLDVVIGFSIVMLGTSLMVTIAVQGISAVLNLRGTALVHGLTDLLLQSGMSGADSRAVVREILGHPFITASRLPRWAGLERWRLAPAIRKTELLRLLAAHETLALSIPASARDRLSAAHQLVEDWFEGQMDRVSQVFAARARVVTICVSFVIAFCFHLDAASLLERLYSEPELRAGLAASAASLEQRAENLMELDVPGNRAKLSLGEAVSEARSIRMDLASARFELLPRFGPRANLEAGVHDSLDFVPGNTVGAWRHLVGILAYGILLSLGAPFWFNALKSLINLRSVLANKEARERKQAQSLQIADKS